LGGEINASAIYFIHFFAVLSIAEKAEHDKRHALCICFAYLSQKLMKDSLRLKTPELLLKFVRRSVNYFLLDDVICRLNNCMRNCNQSSMIE
jgi:hypothetical protein